MTDPDAVHAADSGAHSFDPAGTIRARPMAGEIVCPQRPRVQSLIAHPGS